MLSIFKEKIAIYILLVFSVIIFLSFGLYHITKFETVDEHFWKYERIGKYFEGWKLGLAEGKWKKTYINDKPGVTTAIISGTGLIFEPNPESHRVRDEMLTEGQSYTIYDSERTERINLVFRLPLLIFNSLFLFFFFWIIRKITDSEWLALLTVMLIAFSPILVGISQIINPDTLLWTFAAAAIFSYFALIKTNERKFIILTALFTGLGLLSKYTANILFPFYILIFLSGIFINYPIADKKGNINKHIFKQLFYFFLIALGSVLIFVLIMPAALEKIKYLYRGTIGSQAFKAVSLPFIISIIFIFLDAYLLKSKIIKTVLKFFYQYKNAVFRSIALLSILLFIFVIINPWLGNPIIPLDNVKEDAFVDKDLLFPMLENYNPILKEVVKLAIEMQPFVFSLLPIAIIAVLFLWGKILYKGPGKFQLYIFIISIFLLIYFIATLASGVLANPRYSIMLYPLFAFLSAIGIYEIINTQKITTKNNGLIIFIILIVFSGAFSLWKIKPFYLNYESFFLPKKYVVTDAWGYGSYEAAQCLNSKTNAENLTIWSDRSALCQFIKGKCIRDYKINLNKTIPDYFVFSRRGAIRHKFEWKYPELAKKSNLDYYSDNLVNKYECPIYIGGREKNFVKVIKTEER